MLFSAFPFRKSISRLGVFDLDLSLILSSKVSIIFPVGSLRRRYMGGAFWSMLGTGVYQVFAFFASLVAARILGSSSFGEYGIIQSTIGMLGILAGMGLGLTTTKYVSELRCKDVARCGRIIGLARVVCLASAGVISACVFLLAPFIAVETMNAPRLTLVLRIAGVLLFFNALNGLQIGTLIGFEAFRQIFYINVVKAISTLLFVIFFTWKWGLSGMFVGMTIAAIFACFFTIFIEQSLLRINKVKIIYSNLFYEAEILWKFATPGLISILIPGIVFWIVRTMLVQYPGGYTQLGIFTAADQWTLALGFVASSLNSAGLPMLSNIYGNGDWQQFRKTLLSNVALPVGTTVIVAIGISSGSPWLEKIYGPSFAGISTILVLISIIGVMRVLGGTIGSFIVSIGEMWWGLLFNVVWGTILIIATRQLLDQGALGLAYAYLVAYTLHTLWGGGFLIAKLRSVRASWVRPTN